MDRILQEFASLNRIPRPSGHEAEVAAYLAQWGRDMGYKVVTDEKLNVIFEVPPSEGRENVACTILQAHTDMVCVGGSDYDPLKDPIVTVNDGKTLKASGTSLGADDGIGVSVILDFLKSGQPHGPLRVIFTADEEEGMSGAASLDEAYLQAPYLINLDWEDINSLCLGCAGFLTVEHKKFAVKTEVKAEPVRFSIAGLKGGHSGTEIGDGRANALKLMGIFLQRLLKEDIAFRIASLSGGRAMNVIPYSSQVDIIFTDDGSSKAQAVFKSVAAKTALAFPGEKGLTFNASITSLAESAYSFDDTKDIVGFLSQCPHGVKERSQVVNDEVSLSNNLALVREEENSLSFWLSYRGDADAKMTSFSEATGILGQKYGFKKIDRGMSPAWPPKENNSLASLALKVYKDNNGILPKIESVHAGLECSYFALKNPELEMISIGPTVLWCHSVDEVLYLDSLVILRRWLRDILDAIK